MAKIRFLLIFAVIFTFVCFADCLLFGQSAAIFW